MTNRYILILFSALLIWAPPVQAQSCQIDYELIFKMSEPFVGSYNVWDAVYGEQDSDERFVSGAFESGGWLIAAGERAKAESEDVDLLLVALGRRGRVHWEKSHVVKGLYEVKKIITHGEGFLVLGNKKSVKGRDEIWIGFMGKDGALVRQKTIRDGVSSMIATDIIPAHDGKNYMLATQFINLDKGRASYGAVHKISPKGAVLFGPAFLPGAENKINSLSRVGKGHYIASGYIMTANGRRAGWIMRLDDQLSIDWQRQYSRGLSSEFFSATLLLDRYIVAVGRAYPSTGQDKNVAGWVMAVGADSGDIGWQRYYTGDINYAASDLDINDDGMISVLLDGSPTVDKELDYVRLLTINPRGQLFISNEYFNGEGADGHQLIKSPLGERVIIGGTNMKYTIESPDMPEPDIKKSKEGWVLVGEAAEPYSDPCVQPFVAVP